MNYLNNNSRKKMGNVENFGENNDLNKKKKLDGNNKEYTATGKVTRILHSIYRTFYKLTLEIIKRILEIIVIISLSFYYIFQAFLLNITPTSLRNLKPLKGKIILVTGGAGGVGQELVIRLARQNAKIVVWDINEKAMTELKNKANSEGFKIYTYTVDLADRFSIYKTAEIVKENVGFVDILINNAGIVCGQTLLEIPDSMIEKTYKINTLSCYWTIKAFLPDMIKYGHGHIVTISSLTGLLGTYNCTDYSASKFATIGLHESLWTELKAMGHDKINLTIVCPYFINTGMFEGCNPTYSPMLEPKYVAKKIILAIKQEDVFCTIPSNANYILGMKHFIPPKLNWLLQNRVLRFPQSMKTMKKFNEVIEAA